MKYEQYKVNERYRKLQNKENKAVEVEEAGQCFSSLFTNKQTLHRSLSRADNHVPRSLYKKTEIIEKLLEKYHVKIPFNKKRGRPRKVLNKEKK